MAKKKRTARSTARTTKKTAKRTAAKAPKKAARSAAKPSAAKSGRKAVAKSASKRTESKKAGTKKAGSKKSVRKTAPKAPRTSTLRAADAAAPRPRLSKGERAQKAFSEAVERAAQGFLFDAMTLFRDAIAADPKGDLADDALFNVGGIALQMGLLKDAASTFTELLEAYPDARIAATAGTREFGRTGAKALLGRLRARLAMGDQQGARSDLMTLAGYSDSWVETADGTRRSFHDLGVEAFA